MPDIQLRFLKDMLTLSAPVDATLARQGIDAARDRQYLNLMEPDSIRDALALEVVAGAQCLVTTTEDITRARLAHLHMDGDASKLAKAALNIANEVKPQHILVEIGPCGLPLDASSKSSLNENRAQYADAARAFDGGTFDAFFLNGFVKIADLKCALMGVAQVSNKPVFASVMIGHEGCVAGEEAQEPPASVTEADEVAVPNYPFGNFTPLDDWTPVPLPRTKGMCLDAAQWPEAIDAMVDLGVSVIGFETADPLGDALEYTRLAKERTGLPLLAQLRITQQASKDAKKNLVPIADINEYTPDTMATAATKLYGAGVQFLRATGLATPAYTGALAATVMGLDVRQG